MLEAEKWANSVENLHIHSLNSMWYDNRPEDTEGGKSVTDVTYNSGLVERTLSDGKVVYFGEKLTGEDLLQEYLKKSGASVLK